MDNNNDVLINDDISINEQNDKLLKYLDRVLEQIFLDENATKLQISICEDKISEAYSTADMVEKRVDPNGIFFVPEVSKRARFGDSITSEISSLEKELKSLKTKLGILAQNKQNTVEIISVLSHMGMLDNSDNTSIKTEEYQNAKAFTDEMHRNMLEFQENERNRIARDIHDSTVQNLTSLIHKVELCTKLIDKDLIRTKLEMQTMILTLRNTIDDLRSIIYNLRPMSIDDLGLVATVERHVKNLNLNQSFNTKLKVVNKEYKLLPIVNLTIFRVIQEACNNIVKHAKANNVLITLKYEKKNLVIEIEDDGVGFDSDRRIRPREDLSGLGVSIMKERVFLLSGNICFYNLETGGTKIKVTVPIENNVEEITGGAYVGN
jgi:two-component system sensor histidine kinase DegS